MTNEAPRLRPLRAAGSAAPPRRIVALDGLRAVAVVAVVAYHLDARTFPGGFLGVDVFFVLSGYLITTLLFEEWEDNGSVALGPFWRRRARRLLPPLAILLVGVGIATPTLYAELAVRIRGETFGAIAQGANWFEAFAGHSYFEDIGRASPLRHLWSLGVEAQFYAVWPVLAIVALRHGGRRALIRLALVGASLSFLVMALLFRAGHDPSRIYFGTDTRAGTLLLGAALALGWRRLRPRVEVTDIAGVVALVGLGILALHLDGNSASAYRGGLLLAALLATVVVAALLQTDGRLGRAFALRPLVWLGTRSYAVYLWHWPVIVATRPGLDVDVHGWVLLAFRLGLIIALAEVTTRLAGLVGHTSWQTQRATAHRVVLAAAGILIAAAAFTAQSTSPAPAFYVSPTTSLTPIPSATEPPTTIVAAPETTPTPMPSTAAPVIHLPPPPSGLPPVPPDMPPATGDVRAVAVGESVLVAAGGEVQRAIGPGTVVDADIARQPDDVLRRLAARRAAGYLDHAALVIIQMGTNGAIDMRRMERMAELVEGVPRIVAVTVHVDKYWAAQSNQALREGAARWPWLRLAEWDAAAAQHPEWLGSDGVHPNREGARRYAALVEGAATAP